MLAGQDGKLGIDRGDRDVSAYDGVMQQFGRAGTLDAQFDLGALFATQGMHYFLVVYLLANED